jgi:cobalt-zinc-cadmium resistance protein CzcA
VPLQDVVPRPLRRRAYGWTARDVLDAVAALRVGIEVGYTYDGAVRMPIRVRLASPAASVLHGRR